MSLTMSRHANARLAWMAAFLSGGLSGDMRPARLFVVGCLVCTMQWACADDDTLPGFRESFLEDLRGRMCSPAALECGHIDLAKCMTTATSIVESCPIDMMYLPRAQAFDTSKHNEVAKAWKQFAACYRREIGAAWGMRIDEFEECLDSKAEDGK